MGDVLSWDGNWAWSFPLIVLSVIFHVIGLGIFNARLIETVRPAESPRPLLLSFAVVMGITTLMATLLHAVEATIWAGAYRLLGALPNTKSAMLYSLSAMTAYGHADLYLAPHWQLMGALEALNGMILLGLTTAFLYGTIQRVWPVERRAVHHRHGSPHPSASETGRTP